MLFHFDSNIFSFPSMGWLCGAGVFGLIECCHSLPTLHCWLNFNDNNDNNNNNKIIYLHVFRPASRVNVTLAPAGGRGASVSARAYLRNQLLSCWFDLRICLDKNTDTAIVGDRWTGVGGHHALYCWLVQKCPIRGAWLASSCLWAFRISLSLFKITLKKNITHYESTLRNA